MGTINTVSDIIRVHGVELADQTAIVQGDRRLSWAGLYERAGQVAEAHPELDMNLLTDQWPGENLVNRSDQAAFIPYGIPVLFLTSGTHDDYHQPSDEMDRIDYEKTARLVRLVFWIGWEFAEATVPPGFYQ